MAYTFIANSGIQFYTSRIVIDMNATSKHLFHEWFDEENVETSLEVVYQLPSSQKVVPLSDLEKLRFISSEGRLLTDEEHILAVPDLRVVYEGDLSESEGIFSMKLSDRRCPLAQLLNKWLPLPVVELDSQGEFRQGPYNWCRCKLIPTGEESEGKIEADMVLAFDTRTLYGDAGDDYNECPVFESASQRHKDFRLCDRISMLLDFCTGQNTWVKRYLMQLVHGVREVDDIVVNRNEQDYRYAFLASWFLLVEHLHTVGGLPTFRLLRDRGETIDVEMVVDIGNSRTAAVLFENGDFTKVQQLRLLNFTCPVKDGRLNCTFEPFDMRLAFQKATFGEGILEGSKQFVWPSVVRLGREAELLTHLTTELADGDETLSTYSSPKRYLWDTSPHREEWRCVRTAQDDSPRLPHIAGVSNHLDYRGRLAPDGLGYGLHYSRRTLMTLAFIEIMSQARAQINTADYREFNGKMSTPRRISKVVLTCPTAMSHDEQLALHSSLSDALQILDKYALYTDPTAPASNVQVVPDLERHDDEHPQWIFDEATCSQFVYLYGQFAERYLNNSEEFFKMYGKRRSAAGTEAQPLSLVVGSLDIGAGTSDVMICRYDYNDVNPSMLQPQPLFWDSFDYAGDDMMRMLISNVLLQGDDGTLERELLRRGKDLRETRGLLYRFFGQNHSALSFRDRMLRRDFNIQVLVPVMQVFLDLLAHDEEYREVSYADVFSDIAPSTDVLQHFHDHFGFALHDIKWVYDRETLARIIHKSLDPLIESVATIMYAHDCDLILLSGRPTSLWPIEETFRRYCAVPADRLIVLNKHRVGKWYPFADEHGFVQNAKTVVAMGAMLAHLASNAGRLPNFSLNLDELGRRLKPTTDYFVVYDTLVKTNTSFITPEQPAGSIIVNALPIYIGSRQFDLRKYPVRPFYVLDLDRDAIAVRLRRRHPEVSDEQLPNIVNDYSMQILEHLPLTVTLEREDYGHDKEALVIASIENDSDATIELTDFKLTIQSLNDPDCYWLDSGAFNINIAN
ncbi:MAG: virulence factor SrfB [Muribaculaceae bacterium]|nr:virulence factor SrfB [Muribaculaceae bacterium]